MLLGIPSWKGLAEKVLEDLRSSGKINYADVDQLETLDPRKQLSIASQIAEDKGYDLKLHRHLSKSRDSKIYEAINSIGAPSVTTNYDHELAPKYACDGDPSVTVPATPRVSGVGNINPSYLKSPGTVTHLHGDMKKPETMIVTTKNYLSHYGDKDIQYFLDELFREKVVLFIGYGLEEAEILEHILRRGGARAEAAERLRFSLQPFLKNQESLYERLAKYYEKSFGVHLIGFARDDSGYQALETIMLDWASVLEVRPPFLVDEIAQMDEVLANE